MLRIVLYVLGALCLLAALAGCGGATPAASQPTAAPTEVPRPTAMPTAAPQPTAAPTEAPTAAPTATVAPTEAPTAAPTATAAPTEAPTATAAPTAAPKPTTTPKPTAASKPAAAQVTIKLFQFQPSPITVKPGTRVVWTNDDDIEHSVTSGAPPDGNGAFDSGFFGKGQTFAMTFQQPGDYPYFCRRHPSMMGMVTVAP